MHDEYEKIWKEAVVAKSRHYPGIFLGQLRKAMKNSSKDSQCPGRDPSQAPPKYRSTALRLDQPAPQT